jgi:hypothetical protein
MEKDTVKTKVIFRKFRDGEVIALFPEIQANFNQSDCESYLHIGQHGATSYFIVDWTKPAQPKEYESLRQELEAIGYNLDIKKRIGKRWFEINRN